MLARKGGKEAGQCADDASCHDADYDRGAPSREQRASSYSEHAEYDDSGYV